MDRFLEIINNQLEKDWSLEEKQYATHWILCPRCNKKVMLGSQTAFCLNNDGGCLSCPSCDKYISRGEWEKEGAITVIKGVV